MTSIANLHATKTVPITIPISLAHNPTDWFLHIHWSGFVIYLRRRGVSGATSKHSPEESPADQAPYDTGRYLSVLGLR